MLTYQPLANIIAQPHHLQWQIPLQVQVRHQCMALQRLDILRKLQQDFMLAFELHSQLIAQRLVAEHVGPHVLVHAVDPFTLVVRICCCGVLFGEAFEHFGLEGA